MFHNKILLSLVLFYFQFSTEALANTNLVALFEQGITESSKGNCKEAIPYFEISCRNNKIFCCTEMSFG